MPVENTSTLALIRAYRGHGDGSIWHLLHWARRDLACVERQALAQGIYETMPTVTSTTGLGTFHRPILYEIRFELEAIDGGWTSYGTMRSLSMITGWWVRLDEWRMEKGLHWDEGD